MIMIAGSNVGYPSILSNAFFQEEANARLVPSRVGVAVECPISISPPFAIKD
jgi:hypothetical protein